MLLKFFFFNFKNECVYKATYIWAYLEPQVDTESPRAMCLWDIRYDGCMNPSLLEEQ